MKDNIVKLRCIRNKRKLAETAEKKDDFRLETKLLMLVIFVFVLSIGILMGKSLGYTVIDKQEFCE